MSTAFVIHYSHGREGCSRLYLITTIITIFNPHQYYYVEKWMTTITVCTKKLKMLNNLFSKTIFWSQYTLQIVEQAKVTSSVMYFEVEKEETTKGHLEGYPRIQNCFTCSNYTHWARDKHIVVETHCRTLMSSEMFVTVQWYEC